MIVYGLLQDVAGNGTDPMYWIAPLATREVTPSESNHLY